MVADESRHAVAAAAVQAAGATSRIRSRGKPPQFAGEGEIGDLVFHRWRAESSRSVRSEADADEVAGKPLPASFPRPMTAMGSTAYTPLLAEPAEVSSNTASRACGSATGIRRSPRCVDDLAVIRRCWADGLTHVGSVCQMNTGSILAGRPCLGSWALYGLGTVSDNLPGFVVLPDYHDDPPGGSRQWSTGFMPATYQGTKFRAGKTPILHVAPPRRCTGRGSGASSISSRS